MKEAWQERIGQVTEQADKLLKDKGVLEGVGRIDYAAIFPKSEQEYSELMSVLQTNGEPVREVPTGTVFQLREPLQTPQGEVPRVRVRINDSSKTQIGYVDYWVGDYPSFKDRYVPSGIIGITHNQDGVEMLTTENEEVIVYFPQIPLGKDLGEGE